MRGDVTASARETDFVASLEGRAQEILERCTRCGRCVEVCPTAGPAGVDRSDPAAVVSQVLDL
jgi:heterodisulfide reductase subunit D